MIGRAQQLHQLKQAGPTPVLAEACRLIQAHPDLAALSDPGAYLVKREAPRRSPALQAAGWPIGDGARESGNKGDHRSFSKRNGNWLNPMARKNFDAHPIRDSRLTFEDDDPILKMRAGMRKCTDHGSPVSRIA